MQNEMDLSAKYDALLQEHELLKEACERAWGTSSIYSHIAFALARAYTDLFYVNMSTGEYIEYSSDDKSGMLLESRRATDFFESCEREAQLFVHSDDRDMFVGTMKREFLFDALSKSEEYEITYRRLKDRRSFYVQMRISRMKDDDNYIVIAVSDIDELVKKRRAEERVEEERTVYARLHAITGNFIVVYVVNPETNHFREFSSTEAYARYFALEKEGEDFFERARKVTCRYIHTADLSLFLTSFTKANVLAAIERDGIFTLGYRFMVEGRPIHVQLKAALVEESRGPRLIVGLNDVDAQVRQEKEAETLLAKAQAQANVDALTGVKNKHAYQEAEDRLNGQIESHQASPFAIVVFDVNDLKKVNDAGGHQAGDQHLRNACRIICEAFKRSPVYRVGGDEFAVIAQGVDYDHIEERLWDVSVHNEEALHTGDVVIACGMARFADDDCVAAVFERADRLMYEDKSKLKSETKE
ncbi:MAG: GGDEF domain-containing protein [Atopobiaceae bacterium]|nr:GGDEF domain-containing protein [Atopobiaceae bacterium]